MTAENGLADKATMTDFLDAQIWTRLGDCAARARRKRAAIAYVTADQPLAFGKGDVLVTNASDHSIASGSTAPKVLRELFERGVSLYNFPALHAKVVVLDSTVFVSSANLSRSSQDQLYEAGIETNTPKIRSQALAFIESIIAQSVPITKDFLDRIDRIPIVKRPSPDLPSRSTNQGRKAFAGRIWLVGAHALKEPTDGKQRQMIDQGTRLAAALMTTPDSSPEYVRFGHNERISKLATIGDHLILIWRTSVTGHPKCVYKRARILGNQPYSEHKLIYYEHTPQAEEESLTWTQFQFLLTKVEIRNVSKSSCRELTGEQSNRIDSWWNSARRH
jgi:hypothetical protein